MPKISAALLGLFFIGAAYAQEDPTTRTGNQSAPPSTLQAQPSVASQPASRAEVKSETREAMSERAIPIGQHATPNQTGGTPPAAVSRADIDREALLVEKSHPPIYGLTSQWNQMNAGPFTGDRNAVKASTKAAERAEQIPRGEASSMPEAATAAE
jgi:hypothetical protein